MKRFLSIVRTIRKVCVGVELTVLFIFGFVSVFGRIEPPENQLFAFRPWAGVILANSFVFLVVFVFVMLIVWAFEQEIEKMIELSGKCK